jgi:hypothetical protein
MGELPMRTTSHLLAGGATDIKEQTSVLSTPKLVLSAFFLTPERSNGLNILP